MRSLMQSDLNTLLFNIASPKEKASNKYSCEYLSITVSNRVSAYAATHTLSGRIGKMVASHAAVAGSNPAECIDLYYARGAQGYCP